MFSFLLQFPEQWQSSNSYRHLSLPIALCAEILLLSFQLHNPRHFPGRPQGFSNTLALSPSSFRAGHSWASSKAQGQSWGFIYLCLSRCAQQPLINTHEQPGTGKPSITVSPPAIFKWIVNTSCPFSEHPQSCPWGIPFGESCLFFPLFLELVWHHRAFPQHQGKEIQLHKVKKK